jgi:nitroimidazol reductase NimA-like FMN-containing flavoprotein (pyridoxamine 5'-phosphate oxidase superfamily)
MRTDSSGLEVLSEPDCVQLLAGAQVGRVVVSMAAMPAAFPVNYTVIGRDIYFRTTPGTKLAAAVDRTVVAFQVDRFDTEDRSGWSVLVVGQARLVTDPAEQALLQAAGVRSWVATEPAHFVAIGMDKISGRWLRPAEAEWSVR